MRVVAITFVVALAGCGDEQVSDLRVTGRGLAVTADAVFISSDGVLYAVPRDGGAPRALAEASDVVSDCLPPVAAIEVVGDTVYWLQRGGFVHRVDLVTGAAEVTSGGCPHALMTDASGAYWNRGEGADATLWRWSTDGEPELVGPAQDGDVALGAGWLYGFEANELVQRAVGGDAREVLYTTTSSPGWAQVDVVHDGFVYFRDALGDDTHVMRVPIGGGDVQVLGIMSGIGRTVIADGVMFRSEYRLRLGDDEAEIWLRRGENHDAVLVDDIALEGDDIFYTWRADGGASHVYRRHKDEGAGWVP